jgi:23S rRNA-/tRNA-specific pseudouridylate synthase
LNTSVSEFWATLPLGRDVRLVARDPNGLAAFAKPAGVLSHPNSPKDGPRALLTCAYDAKEECFIWPGPDGSPRRLWLLNRLDSATSGLILAAADAAVAHAIKARFARRQVHKVYEALVFGRPAPPVQQWRDRLAVSKRGGEIRTGATGNLAAEARCALLRASQGSPPLALVRLEPATGRSHQLRVQCAKRGLPIVGDQTYGDFRANREFARRTGWKRLFLHSRASRFRYELGGRSFAFAAEAPTPPEFAAAVH